MPYIRTYRPMPPPCQSFVRFVLPRTETHVTQFFASFEIWTSKSAPYAASHASLISLIWKRWPRSTEIHCGSENWLDQRVEASPSTANRPAYWSEKSEEVTTGLSRATSTGVVDAGEP